MKNISRIFLSLIFALTLFQANAQQRFPKPEFETGYVQPSPTTPEPRSTALEYTDVLVLLAALSLASWLVIKKRSRRGILWLSIFSLLYFGFYREGCICSVGSLQNITLALFDPVYKVSITVLLFFLLPLVFALFFGRTFCAAACPLGAIQDLIIIKPVSLPVWVRKTLSFIPYVYLGFAILYAATGTDFIICRYDPFVGFFRMDAPYIMIVIGIALLILGLFFARPYCRVFCPYGVLLSWMSKFSKHHMSITPAECISCKLCENSCPFDAIEIPEDEKIRTPKTLRENLKRFSLFALLIPVWVFIGGYAISSSHVLLSRAHPDVYLSELLIAHPEMKNDTKNIDIKAFRESGKTFDQLVENAAVIRTKFRIGGWYLGGFLGLVIGIMVMNQFLFRKKEIYEPHKGDCFSCGRCMSYCPVEKLK
ncbi:MAG: 4Fe-4S binding protein [Bacteroidales bacterium]|nr:4Fe-4S binding protein [Bacteroidales bacterium]MCB8999663.1 4Fe-4S binding protein [Bacteroidales bacterium]MCB9012756.1 4Fe-4S binding protein [Bacteroidales bacterium]